VSLRNRRRNMGDELLQFVRRCGIVLGGHGFPVNSPSWWSGPSLNSRRLSIPHFYQICLADVVRLEGVEFITRLHTADLPQKPAGIVGFQDKCVFEHIRMIGVYDSEDGPSGPCNWAQPEPEW
jgi:hypothetical protein